MAFTFDELLAAPIEEAFGESITITRTSGGTYSPAARGYAGGTTVSATLLADVQTVRRVVGGPVGGADLDEVAINIRAATIAATSLGDLREGDLVNVRNRSRRCVSVEIQAAGTIFRGICRSEKRAS